MCVTDRRQTDAHHRLVPPTMGLGHNKQLRVKNSIREPHSIGENRNFQQRDRPTHPTRFAILAKEVCFCLCVFICLLAG